MNTSEKLRVTIVDITGINLTLLNAYNLATCTDPFDGANKAYVDSKSFISFQDIGFGNADLFREVLGPTFIFKTFPTNIFFNTMNDSTFLYINSDMYHMPYPRWAIDTTTLALGGITPSNTYNSQAVYHGNGIILMTESNNADTLVIDLKTNTYSFPNFYSFGGSGGLVNAPNGNIYSIPERSSTMQYVTTSVNTNVVLSLPGISAISKWSAASIRSDGIIYCVPRNDTRVLIFNTNDNSYTTISAIRGYRSSTLAPNGKIYCPPFTGTTVLIINTNTNTCDGSSMVVQGGFNYQSSVLAPNGKIYCVPHTSSLTSVAKVLVIDPDRDVADTTTIPFRMPISTSIFRYSGACLGADGLIYSFPSAITSVLVLDPNTGVVDTTSIGSTSFINAGYRGGVLAPNGKIYCCPGDTSVPLIVNTGAPVINMAQAFKQY